MTTTGSSRTSPNCDRHRSAGGLRRRRPYAGLRGPYTVHLGLEAGDSVPPHTHPGQSILFLVQEGRLELTVGEDAEELAAGEMANFDGDADIAVEAVEDVRALVVFADQ